MTRHTIIGSNWVMPAVIEDNYYLIGAKFAKDDPRAQNCSAIGLTAAFPTHILKFANMYHEDAVALRAAYIENGDNDAIDNDPRYGVANNVAAVIIALVGASTDPAEFAKIDFRDPSYTDRSQIEECYVSMFDCFMVRYFSQQVNESVIALFKQTSKRSVNIDYATFVAYLWNVTDDFGVENLPMANHIHEVLKIYDANGQENQRRAAARKTTGGKGKGKGKGGNASAPPDPPTTINRPGNNINMRSVTPAAPPVTDGDDEQPEGEADANYDDNVPATPPPPVSKMMPKVMPRFNRPPPVSSTPLASSADSR
jgi:hypothetical protein